MISSTFIQGLMAGNLSGELSAGAENVKQGGDKRTGFSSLLRGLMNKTGTAETKASLETSQLKGHAFLEQFKKAIMASGKSLADYEVNADALAEFGNLLLKAGFNREDVAQMLSEIKTGAGEKKMTLGELFNKASQLPEPEEGADATAFLDISSLPYLETILGQLGLGQETIRSILADAKVEGVGIDVETLVKNLRKAMAGDDEGTDEFAAVAEDSEGVAELMQQIGLIERDDESFPSLLDKMIGDLSRFKDSQGDTSGENGGKEISEELFASDLQQLAAISGEKGEAVQRLIASARNENGKLDADALLSGLVQMRQSQSAAAAAVTADTRGEMTLSRFVAALESRMAAEQSLSGAVTSQPSGHSMTELTRGFMAELSSVSDTGKGTRNVTLGTGDNDKRVMVQNPQQAGDKSVAGSTAKGGDAQGFAAAYRETSSGNSHTGGNLSENSAGRDESAKMMDTLNRGGSKTKQTADQNLINADNFLKELKAGEEAASLSKTTSNRTLPGYLLDQVSRQIIKQRASGENEITLQLKPPHLGKIKINVEHTTAGLKVGIVVENVASREMLLANANELRAALTDQGIRMDRIDVEAQADFGKSMAQTGHEFGQSGGRKSSKWGGSNGTGMESPPEESAISERAREEGAGRLDLVA